MKRQPNNNGGFSLLEVILAMAILAIISIPLLSYFTQSMKYNAMMADKQHATNLAQEVLEDLKNQKELAVVTTGAGFRVPYLEGKGYTLLSETPAAAPAPAFQAENVYYAAAGTSGSTYDVEVSVSTAAAENDTNIPQIEGIDDTKDVVALEHNQLQEAMTYFRKKYDICRCTSGDASAWGQRTAGEDEAEIFGYGRQHACPGGMQLYMWGNRR